MAKRIKDQRKQQLIEATMESIAKRGLTETTITHICKGAGLSRGIINFYFESKELLMRGVLAHLLEEYAAIWQQALNKSDKSKQAKLEALIRSQFDRRICSSKRLNVLSAFWGHAASHAAYRDQFAQSDQAIETALAECIEPAKASQLFALIRGLWLRYLLAPRGTQREALAEEAIAFAMGTNKALKVVADNAKASDKKAKKLAVKAAANMQMDIEDLFANG
jgi:AcrR family transcriptional regulator